MTERTDSQEPEQTHDTQPASEQNDPIHHVVNEPFRPSWIYFWNFGAVTLGMLIASVAVLFSGVDYAQQASLLLMASAFVCGAVIWVKRLFLLYEILEDKIVRQNGIIARKRTTIRISDLKSVELEQSIPERILGLGDLAFYTAGSADAEIRFVGIDNPQQWCDEIDRLIELKHNQPKNAD